MVVIFIFAPPPPPPTVSRSIYNPGSTGSIPSDMSSEDDDVDSVFDEDGDEEVNDKVQSSLSDLDDPLKKTALFCFDEDGDITERVDAGQVKRKKDSARASSGYHTEEDPDHPGPRSKIPRKVVDDGENNREVCDLDRDGRGKEAPITVVGTNKSAPSHVKHVDTITKSLNSEGDQTPPIVVELWDSTNPPCGENRSIVNGDRLNLVDQSPNFSREEREPTPFLPGPTRRPKGGDTSKPSPSPTGPYLAPPSQQPVKFEREGTPTPELGRKKYALLLNTEPRETFHREATPFFRDSDGKTQDSVTNNPQHMFLNVPKVGTALGLYKEGSASKHPKNVHTPEVKLNTPKLYQASEHAKLALPNASSEFNTASIASADVKNSQKRLHDPNTTPAELGISSPDSTSVQKNGGNKTPRAAQNVNGFNPSNRQTSLGETSACDLQQKPDSARSTDEHCDPKCSRLLVAQPDPHQHSPGASSSVGSHGVVNKDTEEQAGRKAQTPGPSPIPKLKPQKALNQQSTNGAQSVSREQGKGNVLSDRSTEKLSSCFMASDKLPVTSRNSDKDEEKKDPGNAKSVTQMSKSLSNETKSVPSGISKENTNSSITQGEPSSLISQQDTNKPLTPNTRSNGAAAKSVLDSSPTHVKSTPSASATPVKKTSRPDQGNGSKASGHLPVITSRPPLSTTFDNQSMRSTPLSQGAGQKPISSADTGDSSASESGNSRSRRSSSAQDSTSAAEVDANFARHDQVSTPVSSASNSDHDLGLGDRLSQGFTAFMSVIEWIVLPPLPPSSSSSPSSDSVLPGPRYPRQPPTDQSSSSEASMKPGGGGDRERSTSGKKKLKLRPPRLSRRRYSRAKGAQSKGESNPRLSFSERISQCSPFGRYMPLAILFLLVMTFVCLSLKVPIGRFICYVLACFYTFCVMRHLGILD